MTTTKQPLGARTALTGASGTLASGNYTVSAAYTCNSNQPVDVAVEINPTTSNTPSGDKQLLVFAKVSLDGTNYTSGPESSTTRTQEPNLFFLGALTMPTASQAESRTFSIASAVGFVPYSFKIILFNDLGVALTALTIFTAEVSLTST